jgi:hypothetical protein
MAERKATPDVLADILGADVPVPDKGAGQSIESISDRSPRRPAPPRAAKPRPRADEKSAKPAPVTWAYETVSFQDAHGWRPRFVDGRELRDWMFGPLIHDYVNQRSLAGWELVSVASGQSLYGTSDRYQMYFRKPQG